MMSADNASFKTATDSHTIDGRDDRFVESGHLLHAAKSAHAIIGVRCLAVGGGFEVPAGAKKLFPAARDDRNALFRVIAE